MASRMSKNRIRNKVEDLSLSQNIKDFIIQVLEYEGQKATQRSWYKKPYDELLEIALDDEERGGK